ncbi:YraN family protein [Cohnella laeviribosi]|uniref:YraN family protein n=1 Tax=Cohnella laeviribosi TaxID=380174 RepID=UPI0003792353|nr:YraN family protein [Cohnella laeviribosi]
MDETKKTGGASRSGGFDRRKRAGREAEEAAAKYLAAQGYAIIERNWRCRTGEIDLIAADGGVLVFVEVRSRRNPSRFGSAVEAFSSAKQAQVRSVASVYLAMSRQQVRPVRFDAIAVTFGRDGSVSELRHIPGAF